jgi:ankyrin repeat protein
MSLESIHTNCYNRNVFTYICKIGNLEQIQRFLNYYDRQHSIKNNEDIHNHAFRILCEYGHLYASQWLLEIQPTIDISFNSDDAFRNACQNGHLPIAQWLFEIKPTINISTENEYAFRYACLNGHLHVAKWLLKIKPTIMKFDYQNRINNMSKLYICCYYYFHKNQWNLSEYIIQTICRFI